jgi:ATP-binding cassette, subfamily B, bacterial PglK
MNALRNVVGSVGALIRVIPALRRHQLGGVLMLMVAAAMAEVLSLGALVPFLAVLGDPEAQTTLGRITRDLLLAFHVSAHESKLTLTVLFATSAVLAAIVRVSLNIVLARVNFRVGHELGTEIYRRALYRSYEYHLGHHSSEISGGIVQIDAAIQVTMAALVGVSSGLMALCISLVIFFVDPTVALIAVLGFGGFYAGISVLFHRRLSRNGRVINSAQPQRLKAIQEGLGGIRDVLLDQTQEFHVRRFKEIDDGMRRAQESNQVLGPTPRYLIEALGMVTIAVLGFLLAGRQGGIGAGLPTLGVLVVGGQRLLPMLQQAYQGWAMVAGHLHIINNIVRLASEGATEPTNRARYQALPFNRQIDFADVWFDFGEPSQPVLANLNCRIEKGARVGIVGPTGSGKTTLLNLLMGLLEPTHGSIKVDDTTLTGAARQAWRGNIAHVPQSIFLADASILENVAFGVDLEHIDHAHVLESLRGAQLEEFVGRLPAGMQTIIGENGVRLSGGQRQRIGIARALYKRASVLVLDEATSALDSATEDELVRSVHSLGRDVTIIMIAHRLTSLKGCDFLLTLGSGVVTKTPVHALTLGHVDTRLPVEAVKYESE